MDLREIIKQALSSLKGNKLRAGITMAIIAIGISALVGILTAISGLEASINSNFSALGSNSFTIQKNEMNFGGPRKKKDNEPISYAQATDFKSRFEYPALVSISIMAQFAAEITFRSQKTNPNIRLLGVDENYFKITNSQLSDGRTFTETELQGGRSVAVIGTGIMNKLFRNEHEAIDKEILINNEPFQVIGVLASKGSSGFMNLDNMAFVPLIKGRQMSYTSTPTYSITVGVADIAALEPAKDYSYGIFRMSRELRPGEDNDFSIQSSDQFAKQMISDLDKVSIAAYAIALITLLGAAIGLMNIMLVSVTDRTREIGISKAIGATKYSIRAQFLTEAIVICILGGIMGIIFGILIGNIVSLALHGPFFIPWFWIAFGLIVCFIIGILAGYYPALKASNLDPIEALRYE